MSTPQPEASKTRRVFDPTAAMAAAEQADQDTLDKLDDEVLLLAGQLMNLVTDIAQRDIDDKDPKSKQIATAHRTIDDLRAMRDIATGGSRSGATLTTQQQTLLDLLAADDIRLIQVDDPENPGTKVPAVRENRERLRGRRNQNQNPAPTNPPQPAPAAPASGSTTPNPGSSTPPAATPTTTAPTTGSTATAPAATTPTGSPGTTPATAPVPAPTPPNPAPTNPPQPAPAAPASGSTPTAPAGATTAGTGGTGGTTTPTPAAKPGLGSRLVNFVRTH